MSVRPPSESCLIKFEYSIGDAAICPLLASTSLTLPVSYPEVSSVCGGNLFWTRFDLGQYLRFAAGSANTLERNPFRKVVQIAKGDLARF